MSRAWPPRLALAAALCAGLAGCAVDQAADVATYRGITAIAPPEPFAPGQSLTLVHAMRLADHLNEDLAIAGESYLRLLLERRRRAAALMPTFDAFGTLALRENTGQGGITAFDAGLSGQYLFPTGLGDRRAVEAAEIDADTGRYQLLDVRESLLLDAATAYYEAMRAEALIRVLEASIAVQAERLRDIQGRQNVGFARPLDVAQIEAQASETRVLLLEARSAAERARSALTFITGVEAAGSPLIDGLVIPAHAPPLEAVLAEAERARADLLATRAAASADRARVDEALSQYAPAIGLNLDFFLYRESSPDDLDLASLISLSVPIFSAGRIDADVREAWSLFRESVLRHHSTRRRIRLQVENALTDLQLSMARMAELDIQVAAARETLRQAEAVYAAGRGTNLERIQAQEQQTAAEVRRASEEFTLKLAYLTLRRVTGQLAVDAGATPLPPDAGMEYPAPVSPFVLLPAGPPGDPAPASDPARTTP